MGEWLAFLKTNSPEHYQQACLYVEACQEEVDMLRMLIRQHNSRESSSAPELTLRQDLAPLSSSPPSTLSAPAPLSEPVPLLEQPPSMPLSPLTISPQTTRPPAPIAEPVMDDASTSSVGVASAAANTPARVAKRAAPKSATKAAAKAAAKSTATASTSATEQASPPASTIRLQQEMQSLQYDESIWTTKVLDGIVNTQPDAFFWQAAAQGILPDQHWALEECDIAILHKRSGWFSMYVSPMDAPTANVSSITSTAAKTKWWSTNGKYVACSLAAQLVAERHSASAAELHFHTPVRVVLRDWLMALVDTLSRTDTATSEEERDALCQEATMLANLLDEEFYQRVTTLYRAAAYECVPVWSLAHGMAIATIMARDYTWMPPLRSWSANQVPESITMMDELIERNLPKTRGNPVKGHKRK